MSRVGFVGAGLASRLGIVEPTLLKALPYGSATSNAITRIAAAGSTATFIAATGDFVAKDVAVIREIVAELGADIDRLDDIVSSGFTDMSSTHRKVL